jgi:hypothetical protein
MMNVEVVRTNTMKGNFTNTYAAIFTCGQSTYQLINPSHFEAFAEK